MSMNQGSQVSGVTPTRIGWDDADPEGLRVFRRLGDQYANNVREMGGSGSGSAPIEMRFLIDRSHLELVRRVHLQSRPPRKLHDRSCLELVGRVHLQRRKLHKLPENKLLTALRSLAEVCPLVREVARMESRWPIEKRVAIMRRYVWECLRSRDWTDSVIPGVERSADYMQAAVEALVEGVWYKDTREEVARGVQFKGLQADPDEICTLREQLTGR